MQHKSWQSTRTTLRTTPRTTCSDSCLFSSLSRTLSGTLSRTLSRISRGVFMQKGIRQYLAMHLYFYLASNQLSICLPIYLSYDSLPILQTATKSVPCLAKALRLPQTLRLTLRKCCSCHKHFTRVLRLPRNLYLILRHCCVCHKHFTKVLPPATQSVFDLATAASATKFALALAKVLRLPRNLYPSSSCHAI